MSIISETKSELTNEQKSDTTKKWERVCPKCNATISYRRYWDWIYGCRKGGNCKRCVAIANSEKCKELFRGSGNPFYGKKHSDKSKSKISAVHKGIKQTGHTLAESRRTIKIAKASQQGKSLYQMWVDKYGKEIADRRMEDAKKKWSLSSSGKNNPMYGKPTPNGAGNGWANWYKGFHFRSLRELQYYINEIEGHNVVCESAQGKRFRISYKDWAGVDRTYKPDFFVDNHWLVEVKPQKLWNTKTVVSKKLAAEEFCRRMGYEYKLVDVGLNSLLLKEKYLRGEIRFVDKYKERFEKHAKIK